MADPIVLVPQDIVDFAVSLADASRPVTRRYFRAPIEVDTKSDESPVTIADREAERVMREIINRDRPQDGIIGEEFGKERDDAEFVWVLDPIDGTKSFMAGRPIFGTLIGLLWEGMPVLGIIDQPITGDRWIGVKGQMTWFNNAPVSTRYCSNLKEATIATTAPELLSPGELEVYEAFRKQCRIALWGGDCYNYGLLASGFIDIVIEAGLKLHDFAALVPVVEGAGGKMTDWFGRPLTKDSDGQVIACGDPRLLDAILKAANGNGQG